MDGRFIETRPLADQLGDLRAQIRLLREKEQQLATALRGGRGQQGDRYRAELHRITQRRFARDRLPADILGDARYWKQVIVTQVRTTLCRPPVQLALPEFDDDDFEVIERF